MSEHKHYQMTNTHILVQEFEYLEPSSLEEAISLLDAHGDRAQVLAGGTDLIVQMKMERIAPEYVVNISRVPELDGIVPQNDSLQIGALTRSGRSATRRRFRPSMRRWRRRARPLARRRSK